MPYCEPCSKYHAPTTLTNTGDCPECGHHLDDTAADGDDGKDGTPWHFKLLVVVLVAYLGFRIVQMISWLF